MTKQKGFTLVEMLVVIAILALLFGIGIPTYMLITRNVKQRSYENKVSYALSKAEAWASDTGRTVTNIVHLIEEGYMEADNENGDYDNPVDDTSMLCYTIRIDYFNNQYTAVLTEERYCNYEELEKQTSIIEVIKMDLNTHSIVSEDTWTRNDNILQVQFKNNEDKNKYQNSIESIEWKGNSVVETIAIHNDFSTKNQYNVRAAQFMNTRYEVTMKIVYEGRTFIYKAYTQVKIDRQNPIIYQDEISVDRFDEWTQENKDVHITTSDFDGSGVYGYYVSSSNASCSTNKFDYNALNGNLSFDSSLSEGVYYACVMDNVGNVGDNAKITVVKTDKNPPVLTDFEIAEQSKGYSYYNRLALRVRVIDEESGPSVVRYCITTNESCDPNATMKLDANGAVVLHYKDAKKAAQKICAIGIDNAGNQSAKKCSNAYLFDNTAPKNVSISVLKEDHDYVVDSYSASDAESGMYSYQIEISLKDKNQYVEVKDSNKKFLLKNLNVNSEYDVRLTTTNKSGLTGTAKATFKAVFDMEDAAYKCVPDENNNYCNDGVYIKYSGRIFVLYRQVAGSVFGLDLNETDPWTGSLITGTCCDSGDCVQKNVYNTDRSGIYGYGKYGDLYQSEHSGGFTLRWYFEGDAQRYGLGYTKDYQGLNDYTNCLNQENYNFFSIVNKESDWQVESLDVGSAKVQNDKVSMKWRYGLLDFEEYAAIRNKSYMKDISSFQTLLSTVYPYCYIDTEKATYEGADHNDTPWHHICNEERDTIMAISVQDDTLTFVPAVAQVLYEPMGKDHEWRKSSLTVPFSKKIILQGGNGTKEKPYIIEKSRKCEKKK